MARAAVAHPPGGCVGSRRRGPALLTLASVPLRSSLVLGGFLFSALLVVIAVAVIGGTRPALTAVVLCVLTRVFFFAPPFTGGVDMQANPVSLAAFTIVAAGVAILIVVQSPVGACTSLDVELPLAG